MALVSLSAVVAAAAAYLVAEVPDEDTAIAVVDMMRVAVVRIVADIARPIVAVVVVVAVDIVDNMDFELVPLSETVGKSADFDADVVVVAAVVVDALTWTMA